MFYYISDLHGKIAPIIKRIRDIKTDNVKTCHYFICLGDAGLNYFLDDRDKELKRAIQNEIISSGKQIKCIFLRGNHDVHPCKISTYEKADMYGGEVFIERMYPDLIFLAEADVYSIDNQNYIVFSGGYSKDWFQRILRSEYWSIDEQISNKEFCSQVLKKFNDKIDQNKKYCLLGHQLPREFSPEREYENEMDIKTELHLQTIFQKYSDCIYEIRSGHYHTNMSWRYKEVEIHIHYTY